MNSSQLLISSLLSARDALRQLDKLGAVAPVLFVEEKGKIVGSLTDGDIRRGLIQHLSIDDAVTRFMFPHFRFFSPSFGYQELAAAKALNIRWVPLVDEQKQLIRFIDTQETQANLPITAVIMAGGRGERLKPLTDITPKPMLQVGDKPIIEHNLDLLRKYGITDVAISIRYLGEQIQSYFGDGSSRNMQIDYLYETTPLGTIGAVSQLLNVQNPYVLVMNSDLLTDISLVDFFNSFLKKNADMAVAAVPYMVNVPYAVLEVEGEEKKVFGFKEKPSFTYFSNAGIYLLKRELMSYVPDNKRFDATDLMELVLEKNLKLVAEPIVGYWLDIGRMEDYKKAQEDIKHLGI
ncbi:MAG: nucleotidyltransferase family protein [Spirosomataceae bacterium]